MKKAHYIILSMLMSVLLTATLHGQQSISEILQDPKTNWRDPQQRAQSVERIRAIEVRELAEARKLAKAKGIPVRQKGPNGSVREVAGIDDNGELIFHVTTNANAAISSGANQLYTSPFNLDGAGLAVGVWDAGSVLSTHVEFNEGASSRVTSKDGATTDSHATHVGGTIAAFGVSASAKGMAPAVLVDSYDWGSDVSEITASAATAANQFGTKIYLSNHSYSYGYGWSGSRWDGTGTDQNAYESGFGRYQSHSRNLDNIAYNAPYYLGFYSAGNERSNNPNIGSAVTIGGSSFTYDPAIHPAGDGLYRSGFETIGAHGVAKNVITIGAANDAVSSGVRNVSVGTISGFSSTGPCDDGRIKPDIVANGVGLTSTSWTGGYVGMSGTSMSSPSACGSAALLVERYRELFGATMAMRASTLKGLIIHTATDVGNAGPDYTYGWGYMDVKAANDLLTNAATYPTMLCLREDQVSTATPSKNHDFFWDGSSPIRVTLSWTDPAGVADSGHDNRAPDLINNLNVKLIAPDNTEYFPFVMPFVGTWTVDSMSLPATTGINNTDNVEQILVNAPGQNGQWRIVVSYAGTLTNGVQDYGLLVSGSYSNPEGVIAFDSGNFTVNEGAGTAAIIVNRVGGDQGAISVDYATGNGTAIAGSDYTTTSGTLSWANGDSAAKTITIPITDDSIHESPQETFYVTLSNAVGTSITGTNPATVTIIENDNQLPVVGAGNDQTIEMSLTPWSPSSLLPALWLDAADASSISLNGSTVSQWRDKSVNGRDAAQATASAQPTLISGGLNSKNVLRFDGATDYFNVDLDFMAGKDHSVFVVTKPTTYSNIYGAANGGAGANSLHVGFASSTNYRMNYWSNDWNGAISANFQSGAANLLNYVWRSGTSKQIFANGKSEGSNASAGVIGLMSGGGRIGNVTGLGYYGGDIAEFIAFDKDLSTADRQELEGFLAHKWGMQTLLDASHPHKILAPDGFLATTNLTGSATDADGDLLTYSWSMFSGPSGGSVSFGSANALSTTATFTLAGTYTVRLSVFDGYTTVSDDVIITVNMPNNDPPVFTTDPIAGSDATEDTAYSGTLAGSATDPDSDPLTYAKASGPAWLNIASNGTLSGTPVLANVGINSFVVSVSDGKGGSDTATLNITVNAFPNTPPTVDAGPNQFVTFTPGVPWTPANITTSAWYDAADASTITASAGAVSQWRDKSGNSRNINQTTAGFQPTHASNTVSFDGADDYLWNENPFMYANNQIDIFVVAGIAPTTDDRLLSEGSSTSDSPLYCIAQTHNSTASIMSAYIRDNNGIPLHNQSNLSATGAIDDTRKLYQWKDTGSQVSGRVNGGTETTSAYSRSGILTMDRFSMGAVLRASTVAHINADVNEMVICNNLSSADREKMEGYLAHKWGLAASLPASHPYKSLAPGGGTGAVANLNGTVSDADGNPLTTLWSVTNGPGSVAFDDGTAVDPVATFTVAGTYVLRLTADDGRAQSFDEVTINVLEEGTMTYNVDFVTDGTAGASLSGDTNQIVVEAGSATAVTANAPAGYHFVRWTKDAAFFSADNPLTVTNVTAAMTLTAVFAKDASIAIADDGLILEENEDGEAIVVTLSDATFVDPITPANWTLSGMPVGVSKGSVTRINDTTVRILLSGNRATDYDSNITGMTVTCVAAEVWNAVSPLSANSGVTFTAIDDAESIEIVDDGWILEGAENGELITVILNGGTFANTLNAANWTVSDLPAGVSKGAITRVNSNVATIALSGNRSGTYGGSDITNVMVSCGSAEYSDSNGGGSLSDNSGVVLRALAAGSVSLQDGVNGYSGTRDTYIDHSNPGTNYGTGINTAILLNNRTTPSKQKQDKHGFLYFDLSTIPSGTVITGVTVELTDNGGDAGSFGLYEATASWVEAEATYTNDSGKLGSTVASPISFATGSAPGTVGSAIVLNLNAQGISKVQEWINNSLSNNGFTLSANTTDTTTPQFRTREHATQAHRPKLTVTFASGGGSAPEINVQGNGLSIVSGDTTPTIADHTDFGSCFTGGSSVLRTFTIQNMGNSALTLGGTPLVAISGTHAGDYSVSSLPVSSITAGGSTTFTVTFAPSASGVRNATISIDNNDGDESPYTFVIEGEGVAPVSSFTTWAGGAGFSEDSNGDGISNGLAWVLGAPDVSAGAGSLLPTFDNSDPGFFILNHRLADAAAADPNTVVTVEYSDNLIDWNTAVDNSTTVKIQVVNDDYSSGVDRVEVKISRDLAPTGKLFSRLKVNQTP